MAKLQVTPALLAQSLFQDELGVEIVGASFDHQRGVVVLEITGHGVPDAEYVRACVTKQRLSVTFAPTEM